ncbi:enoyl-CoA hydratase/isomerase family protein [Pollutimonas bauzanensis]|uniref:enoyl-CoA hydratase/isomerase family protein n=1 Tax=Pollutimonas bauzanensis TaxID=658167 RepID=UPI003341FDD9
MTDSILVEDRDGIRHITLSRAQRGNALTAAMLVSIARAVKGVSIAQTGLILLRSTSAKVFCAGGDIDEFLQGPKQLATQGAALKEAMLALSQCPVPVLAIAAGKAAGAGVILLAMTDIVIAAENLSLSCPEIAFNMYPVIVQAALETKISSAQARQLCISGQPLDAKAAQGLGLVTDIFTTQDFDSYAQQRLEFYTKRREALLIARKARLLTDSPASALQQLDMLEPLMHENFDRPGVQESIRKYLADLRATRAA